MSKTSESGGWDQDALGSGRTGSTIVKQTPRSGQAKVVRDDWDDDDDDEDVDVKPEQKRDNTKVNPSDSTPEQNAEGESSKIWEEANKRTPMPELIVAPASTSQTVSPPPPAALQPTLRILKRPSPSSSANHVGAILLSSPTSSSGPSPASGGTSPAPRGTLAEREAQYQEARSRIFGEKEKLSGASSGGVVVVRDPLGPTSMELESDKVHSPARGFGERRRGKK